MMDKFKEELSSSDTESEKPKDSQMEIKHKVKNK